MCDPKRVKVSKQRLKTFVVGAHFESTDKRVVASDVQLYADMGQGLRTIKPEVTESLLLHMYLHCRTRPQAYQSICIFLLKNPAPQMCVQLRKCSDGSRDSHGAASPLPCPPAHRSCHGMVWCGGGLWGGPGERDGLGICFHKNGVSCRFRLIAL